MNSLQFEAVARAQHAATNPSLGHISHLGPAQMLAIAQSREAQIHGARMRQSHEQDKDRAMAGLGAWMMKTVHNRQVTNFIRPGWEVTADFISILFISREYQEAFMRAAQPPLTSDPRPVTGNISC